jgi:hypothetical protein
VIPLPGKVSDTSKKERKKGRKRDRKRERERNK